jgi:hypothetical protein
LRNSLATEANPGWVGSFQYLQSLWGEFLFDEVLLTFPPFEIGQSVPQTATVKHFTNYNSFSKYFVFNEKAWRPFGAANAISLSN